MILSEELAVVRFAEPWLYIETKRYLKKMFRKYLKSTAKTLFRMIGFDIVRYSPETSTSIARRLKFMRSYKIGLVFDVGANIGQYATQLRQSGYTGRIVSFEPLTTAYMTLVGHARNDCKWETANIGIGNYDGKATINISANSFSSSILDILPIHLWASPESKYIGCEEISVRKIDSIISEYLRGEENIYLKIDTQGYEKNVIEGAELSLKKITGLEMEISLISLYKDEALLPEMLLLMNSKGFIPVSIEPGFHNPCTGQLLQVDCIFFRPIFLRNGLEEITDSLEN